MAAEIAQREPTWRVPRTALELGPDLRWKPDLEAPEAALHVQLTQRLPAHIVRRLQATAERGIDVNIALPAALLWDEDIALLLADTDARLFVIGRDDNIGSPEPILDALSSAGVLLSSSTRKTLAATGWKRCREAQTANEKGHRLEGLLAFLLGQSQELRVVERRLRTETEEIDLVTQPSVPGLTRCWANLGAPFILIEAKNWSDRVGKPVVSEMLLKLRGYRGTAKVGILVGAGGFTQDARYHELRYAAEEGTIAFVGPEELDSWASADDLDDYFEALVRRAMLR